MRRKLLCHDRTITINKHMIDIKNRRIKVSDFFMTIQLQCIFTLQNYNNFTFLYYIIFKIYLTKKSTLNNKYIFLIIYIITLNAGMQSRTKNKSPPKTI